MTQNFSSSIIQGDLFGAIRFATINGALWAIGSSWSNAIRETTRALLPNDTIDVVLAEMMAATLTTVLGITIAICVVFSSSRVENEVVTRAPAYPDVIRTARATQRR